MHAAESTPKNLRGVAVVSAISLGVVLIVYLLDRPHNDYRPAITADRPSSAWKTITLNAGEEFLVPPFGEYPTHYHVMADKASDVTSSGRTFKKRRIGSGEVVCLLQETWKNKERPTISIFAIENGTVVKFAQFAHE